MGSFISYILQSAVFSAFLYAGYKWLLSTSTFYKYNRIILLAIYISTWILPAIGWNIDNISETTGAVSIEPSLMTSVAYETNEGDSVDIYRLLSWIYISGAILITAYTAASIYRIIRTIREGEHTEHEGYTLVVNANAKGPFSWIRWIVIRPCDIDDNLCLVIKHERRHLQLHHWIDLALAQITLCIQWFNPAAWMLMHELNNLHEYQADKCIQQPELHRYQIMLIKKTVGSSFPTFTDSLNNSLIKNRIIMMKRKSNPTRRIAALALLPMAIGGAATIATPFAADILSGFAGSHLIAPESYKEESLQKSEDKITKIASLQQSSNTYRSNNRSDKDQNGSSYIDNNSIQGTEEVAIELASGANQNNKGKEQSPAYFIDGKPFSGNLMDINSSDIKRMEIIKDDPAYPQGKIMMYTSDRAERQEVTHRAAEVMAEFKGGESALLKFLSENAKYPADAEKSTGKKRVIVQFTIDETGNVSDPKIMRGGGEAFDAEAVRLIMSTSGHWIPAHNNGKNVSTRFTLPITFSDN